MTEDYKISFCNTCKKFFDPPSEFMRKLKESYSHAKLATEHDDHDTTYDIDVLEALNVIMDIIRKMGEIS